MTARGLGPVGTRAGHCGEGKRHGHHLAFGPAALDYAARGWAVFPLHGILSGRCSCSRACPHPAKHPVTRHGLRDARDELLAAAAAAGLAEREARATKPGQLMPVAVP